MKFWSHFEAWEYRMAKVSMFGARGGRSWWNVPTLLYFSPFWYLVFTCPRPPLWHLPLACPVPLHFLWLSLILSLPNFISLNESDLTYPQGEKQSYWINFGIWYVLTECLINASYFKKLGLQKWLIIDSAACLVAYKDITSIPNGEVENDMAQVYSPDRRCFDVTQCCAGADV